MKYQLKGECCSASRFSMAAHQENASDPSCDDLHLSSLLHDMDGDGDQISSIATSDAICAQELQLQEALVASTMMINTPQKSVLVQEELKAEIGQSSQSFCEICVEKKGTDQIYTVQSCSHVFCNDCVSKHVGARLEYKSHTIVCPAVNCEGLIEFHSCQSIVPKNLLDMWDELLCESAIQASQKFYCPFKDCSAMLLRDTDEVIREAECPTCFRLFCAQCSVPWHPAVSCEEFGRMSADEKAIGDLMLRELAKEKSWNRCPRCRYYVERIEGCTHMTCRCGFQFCYTCGDTWTTSHGGCQPGQPLL